MALKTNSKEARAAVMAYIREWCADYVDGYSDSGSSSASRKERR